MQNFPFDERCVFWRRSRETCARRRNPLFAVVPLAAAGGGDWLHTFSLGILLRWCGWVVWSLILCNAWQVGQVNLKMRIHESLRRLNRQFALWYRVQVRRGRKPTKIRGVKRTMLGKAKAPRLRLHGAQANTYLKFLGSILPKHSDMLRQKYDADKISRCHAALQTWLHLVQDPDNDACIAVGPAERMLDSMETALSEMQDLGIHFTPKYHMWVHITCEALRRGSPNVWACWLDEDLNSTLKKVSTAAMHGPRQRWPFRVVFDVNAEMERRFCDQ